MSYGAIITAITNIRPHGNADRIQLGTASGHQVVISKNTVEGTMGIFFPCDGQLSTDMCYNNNLHSNRDLNINHSAKGGFFGKNRRVRAQKFRGEKSEGFWIGLEALGWTGVDLTSLTEGQVISEVNGNQICNKYYTPATIRAIQNRKNRNQLSKKGFKPTSFPYFKEHWSVPKLRMAMDQIPAGSIICISEKCHGTSARRISKEKQDKKSTSIDENK